MRPRRLDQRDRQHRHHEPDTDALNAVSVKKGKTATLKFRISEPADLSPSAKVVLKVKAKKGGRTPMTKTLNGVPMNAPQTYSFKVTFKKGSYKWYVYATDLAGNTQANIDKASFTVKRGGTPAGRGRRTQRTAAGGGQRASARRRASGLRSRPPRSCGLAGAVSLAHDREDPPHTVRRQERLSGQAGSVRPAGRA